MSVKLNNDKIKYIAHKRKKETTSTTIAEGMKISLWHVRYLWAKYRSIDSPSTIRRGGRPITRVTLIENLTSYVAVQKFADVEPD